MFSAMAATQVGHLRCRLGGSRPRLVNTNNDTHEAVTSTSSTAGDEPAHPEDPEAPEAPEAP